MEIIRIRLYDLLFSISKAGDFVTPVLMNHQQKVAYLSFKIAEHLGLQQSQQIEIMLAGLVHDIGALAKDEKLELMLAEPENIHTHSIRGANLLRGFSPLRNISEIIRYHHVPWDNGNGKVYNGQPVPFASHIVHLADKVCIMHSKGDPISFISSMVQRQHNSVFVPELVDCLLEFVDMNYIWLDLNHDPLQDISDIIATGSILPLEIDNILELSYIFSHIIDFRSRFTACHSAGVASTAEKLAELFNFSPYERKMMLIAGYLHDLGKLSIDNGILEKPDKLTERERAIIQSHTYYTYHWLKPIKQFQTINLWASLHHEKLNGKGYPFKVKGDNLSLGSRIMAVADIFTAVTEDRPYRKGLDRAETTRILNGMVKDGSLDPNIVSVLIEQFVEINDLRIKSQAKALEGYKKFMESI
jgi:HD-GYP domain-containing protein (c-di-GMP phosphodiesterase class II)